MKFAKTLALRVGVVAAAMLAGAGPAQAQPNPVLYITGLEYYSAGGKNWVRHRYDVFNKDQYPAAMFAPAPGLPPCGSNTNSSRSWVDFFDSTGKRLYGFCASEHQPGQDLVRDEEGTTRRDTLHRDPRRQTNRSTANMADTTLKPDGTARG